MSLLAALYRFIKPTSCGQQGMIYSAQFILNYLLSSLLDMISPEKCVCKPKISDKEAARDCASDASGQYVVIK